MHLLSPVTAFVACVLSWLVSGLSLKAVGRHAKAIGLLGFAAVMLAAMPAAAQSPNFNSYNGSPNPTGGVGARIVFTVGFNSGNKVVTSFTMTSALPGVTYSCTPVPNDEIGQQITCTGTYFTTASDVALGRAIERPVARLMSFSTPTNRTGSTITVTVLPVIPAPVASNFTSSAVAYNTGSASVTTFSVASQATYDPTSYAVGSGTTANGGSVSIDSAGLVSYTPPVGFRGNDSFTYTATNAGGTSSPATVTVPVNNPTLSSSLTGSAQQGVALSGVQINTTGGKSPYTCATSVSSGALPSGVALNSNCSLTGTPTSSGTFNFTVAVTDSTTGAGPFTQTSGALSLVVAPGVPTVTAIAPTAGPTGGGTSVTITGNNLTGATAVVFGATPATTYTVVGNTQITATAPAGSAGTVDVRVTTTGGTSATSAADQYTYVPAPTVTSVSPTVGPTGGGTTVTITGANLLNATAVTFGATPATGFTVNGATSITATAPAGTGTVDVRITTVGGTSATNAGDQFTYVAAPTVTSISPTAGPVGGGTAVTLTGTNFTGVTAVTFGATPATGFTFNSPTSITATAPAGSAGTVDVRVTTAGGTSPTSAADQFTYVQAPTVTSISPTAGPTSGGTTVIITGSGFAAAPGTGAVKFGATNATYVINSNTQITATSPANGAGTYDVTVTTVGGASATSAADQFTYVATPAVTSVSPTSGPTTGGTTVTITGANLLNATAVTFGATPATGFTVNGATSITATAPAGTGTVDVRVTTVGGTSATNAGDQFTFVAAPTVTSISPTAGPVGGGTAVTLTGTNFTGVTAVTFGATPATGFTFNSATSITATAPAGTGTVDIRVTTVGGTSATSAADQYTYLQAIGSSVSFAPDPLIAGTSGTFTITLTNPNAANSPPFSFLMTSDAHTQRVAGSPGGTCTVGSASVPTTTSVQLNNIVAPPGACTITFSYQGTSAGTATFGVPAFTPSGYPQTPAASVTFQVIPAVPTVTALSPASGPLAGGTSVTLTGTDFTGVTAVRFGAVTATGFTYNSATSITATAPAGSVGVADVTVTTPSGTSSTSGAGNDYTYVAAPAAPATITPANGALTSDNTPAYTGTALTGSTVSVIVDGASVGTTTADGGGNWSFTQPTGLADGSHTVQATATNVGGTSPGSNTNTFTVDTTPPPAPVVTAPANGSVTNNAAASVTGTAEGGSTVTVFVDGAVAGTATADGSGNWSFTTAPLSQGAHTVRATATDPTGNTSPSSATNSFTYSPLSITGGVLAGGQVGVSYSAAITASGGVTPYSFALTGGALPAGVSLASDGALSGTPTASGVYSFSVTATDQNSLTATGVFNITIAAPAPPVADPETTTVTPTPGGGPTNIDLSGSVEGAASIQIVTPPAKGTVTVNGLGVVYTPEPGFFGTVTFTYSAVGFSNGGAPGAVSAPATVTITIPDPVLAFPGGALPAGTAATAYSQTLSASGGTAPYTYALTAGALPAGITLSSAGVLSGTPTAGGNFSFSVTATDSSTGTGPFTVTASYTLAIAAPAIAITPATLPAGATATAYNQTLTASGGNGPYTYALTAGALPAGITLSSAGVLSGTPTSGGSFNFTVTATDSTTGAGPYTGSQAYTLTVAAATVVVTPTSLPAASRGFAYSQSFSATGGTGPYTFSLQSGPLPAGVTLSATGVLSGTPTVTGSFPITVRATDSSTGTGPYFGDVSLTLVVNAPAITVTPTALPGVMAGVAYNQQLSSTGGSGAVTYAVTSGALPAGITLTTAGRISGTSYAVGSYPFTVTATDAFGNTGTVVLRITIMARPDPSADPDVRGLDAAQAEATRRLTETQIGNFNRRLEQLHSGGGAQTMSMGLSLNSGVTELGREADLRTQLAGGRMFGRQSMADPDRAELNAMLWRDANAEGLALAGASGKAGFGSNTGMGVGGLNAAPVQSGDGGPSGGLRFWTGGAIAFGERDGDTGQSKFAVRSGGISLGADMAVSPTLDIGIGGGFGEESADVGVADSSVDSTSFVGVVYGSWRPRGGVYLDAMLGYGTLEFDLQRRVTADNSLVTGSRDGTAVFGSVGLGYDRPVAIGHVNAYTRIESMNAELDAYTESGSPLWALSYDARDVESLQGVLGARYAWTHEERDSQWTPSFRVEYRHEFADGGIQSLQYADWLSGPTYQIQSTGWDRSEFALDLGLNMTTTGGWTATGEVGGRFANGQTLGTLRFMLSKKF
ncbi:MAG: IPT/TIG domain-containing protein [Pseudomonadota bacterium]